MPLRYLFGPVPAAWAGQYLQRERQAGACLAFDTAGGADLTVGPGDTWEVVSARLPDGWRPDCVVLYLPYRTVPAWLWSVPVPLVALAPDWNLLWHAYRGRLRGCDLALTDQPGVERLAREGIAHARAANLFACEEAFLDGPWPEGERDIDVLFVGNLHPAVQRERLAWLARLARLGERWRVAIRTNLFGEDYRRLLGRARVVFNRSIRGECNRRAFEAAAAGALFFQEEDNGEVPAYFRKGEEYVAYNADNLESLLEHYLGNEDQRRAVAEAGRARARRQTFEALWQEQLTRIAEGWNELRERAGRRPELSSAAALLGRTWQALSAEDAGDPALAADLAAGLAQAPHPAMLHNALGLAAVRAAQGTSPVAVAARAAEHFRRAVACDPGHVVAWLNLAEALTGLGQFAEAVPAARHALAALERLPALDPELLDAPHYPPGFDLFRVEWERAAWAHAGRPTEEAAAKRLLLRWRLHALLAQLTGDLAHYHEAALARPDLPVSRAALGCALARAGRLVEAAPHLRQAVSDNPFDLAAARALYQTLSDMGDPAARRLAHDRRLLAQAAAEAVPAEPWFTDAPPAGDELASLIVLCCNEVEYTRPCLESVLRHTRAPYELIVVDNGSTDGTGAYLEELRSRPGPVRVEVIRNETNRGFPAGCNQGLARARGRYLVLLNNDTLVTEGWLGGLIAWALHDWPRVGLVGAVTNYSRPPQQVPVDYDGLDGLDAFAARRRREYAGRAQEVERLTGFCLLLRREVYERLGGFDEAYGLGFFDDDDLSVRARQAGFRLLLAQDVFIHHAGSRTFRSLGVNCPEQLRTNFARFAAKWGPEHSAGYGGPVPAEDPQVRSGGTPLKDEPDAPARGDASPALALRPCVEEASGPACSGGSRPRVSLCMIVKDEEANLPDCLRSVADLVDEVIVVDTGSTDRTRELAGAFGARVFDFPWCDSFAAARNETLRHATGDWVFWLDADDRLDDENREKLRAVFAGLDGENVAYAMKCLCLPDPVGKTATVVDHVRLFRNRPDVRWRYRVHEQILPAVRRAGGDVRWSEVVIRHVGYQDPALRARKLQRDLRLLLLERDENPDDPFTLFNLGSVYLELRQPAEALPVLRRSLERSHPRDSIVRKLYALVVQGQRQQGRTAEALADCQTGLSLYPEDAELLFQEALLRRELGDREGAVAVLLRLLHTEEAAHFASVDAGLRGYKARHNLALTLHELGRAAEAEAHWLAAVAERADFLPGWLGLAELYLAQQRWPQCEQVLRRALELPESEPEVSVFRARLCLARQEYAPARTTLAAAILRHPQALEPRVLLTHALLQEGQDWVAAERALLDVLALDPKHTEARQNLVLLRHKRSKSA